MTPEETQEVVKCLQLVSNEYFEAWYMRLYLAS